ncbi:hypothetical protein AU468_06440 [Alkalispirochaeta sphaeroplastigenens]|uniref:Uncharacterized protein n=1 Tax=Alkalispirochaeta sphaeroplastigenens TaxID=1187066 RepID=A0A2S4JRS3_9SPIO|nr:hypothetical protein [Alkalispirochaeta sphaeroplastigenens]POR02225.1 hypothetical protein AU468_06440 [Alkalispirochaeta sphaeroplastigenens]
MSRCRGSYRVGAFCRAAAFLLFQLFLLDHLAAREAFPLREELAARGFSVESFHRDGLRVSAELRHRQGFPVVISSASGVGSDQVERFLGLHELLEDLPGLQIGRIRLALEGSRMTAVVLPREYRLQGEDYLAYLPGGMRFVFEEAWTYDFRLLVESFSLRVQGQFLTARQLSERIISAVENPAGYIRSSDPYYLAQRLEQQQRVLEDLGQRLQEQTRALEDQRQAQAAALAQTSEELTRTFREALTLMENELERARRGVVLLEGRSLFGSLRDLSPQALAAAFALLGEEPSLDPEELRERVNRTLPEGVAPLHRRHAEAVLAVSRGELPER